MLSFVVLNTTSLALLPMVNHWPLVDVAVPSNGGTLDAGVTLYSTKLSF